MSDPQSSAPSIQAERITWEVQPKSSIPDDITQREYAQQCIEATESSRLNPFALHPDEYLLLREYLSPAQVTNYLNIRNGILRLWMRNPGVAVTRKEAVGCADARWFDAASICYDWLVRRGFINYGCVSFKPLEAREHSPSQGALKQRKIVVLGAGMSGMSCARQMEGLFAQYADRFEALGELPPKVCILEGRRRIGGRVYSRQFQSLPASGLSDFSGERCTAEMGGMIITGFERGNPLNVLVRAQLGIAYHALRPEAAIYDSDGKVVDIERDRLVEGLFNDCLDRVSEYKFKPPTAKLIEGHRGLIKDGKDSMAEGSKTILQVEKARAALPSEPPVSQQNVPARVNLVPTSADKFTGRMGTQPGTPATTKAYNKLLEIGWSVRTSASEEDSIDLEPASQKAGATMGSVMDDGIAQYRKLLDLTPQDYRLLNWHAANHEYSVATTWSNLSLGGWDIDNGNEWEGKHTMVVGGYQRVLRGLLHCPTTLDVRTKSAVKEISYGSAVGETPATIKCEDGTTVEADAVVCSIPLGVLKSGSVSYNPQLPEWKAGAISRLGFGTLNKVVLVYDKVFWDDERHIFGALRDPADRASLRQTDYSASRGRFFQWFNVSPTSGLPCLIGLMAGEAALAAERTTDEELVAEATAVLQNIFGQDVPHPIEAVVTRWGSDKFARGSYSSGGPNMQPDDYDLMARPVGNLFFAGEHTTGTHPATVHGAYLTGLRAASEVLESLIGPINVPEPLVLPKEFVSEASKRKEPEDPELARQEAYEVKAWEYINGKIGERPPRPAKLSANPYIIFITEKYNEKKASGELVSEPGQKPSKKEMAKITKLWNEASEEIKAPYHERVNQMKLEYLENMADYKLKDEKWVSDYTELRSAYEKENPYKGGKLIRAPKHRRTKRVSYAENDSDVDA